MSGQKRANIHVYHCMKTNGGESLFVTNREWGHKLEPGMATPSDIAERVSRLTTKYVPTVDLPRNIRESVWLPGYIGAMIATK